VWAGIGVALGAAALGLAGCRYDGTGTKMQWAPDMADSPAVKAQKGYLDPPEGAISMSAVQYPKTVEEAEKMLQMPPRIAGDSTLEPKGEELFKTFCAVCHGDDATGQHGYLGDSFPHPPDLTHPAYASKGDGFFFYRITFGSAIMPSYGHAISIHERWMIIKHLRTLQKAAPKP
jgi:mono/diheme cytochrome c family protein